MFKILDSAILFAVQSSEQSGGGEEEMALEKQVEEFVNASGMSRDQIATVLGLSRTSLYNKLSGKSEFTLDEAYILSRLLGITVDEIADAAKATS